MKRALLLGLLAIAVGGCATGVIAMAPDGYPATYVRCNAQRMDRCYVKAERLCPYGYYMVAPPGYGALMIRCN
jgi:hypothetical protein